MPQFTITCITFSQRKNQEIKVIALQWNSYSFEFPPPWCATLWRNSKINSHSKPLCKFCMNRPGNNYIFFLQTVGNTVTMRLGFENMNRILERSSWGNFAKAKHYFKFQNRMKCAFFAGNKVKKKNWLDPNKEILTFKSIRKTKHEIKYSTVKQNTQ